MVADCVNCGQKQEKHELPATADSTTLPRGKRKGIIIKRRWTKKERKSKKKKKLSTRERWPASGEKLDDNSILSCVRRVQSIPAPGCTNWRTRVFFSFFFSFPHFLVLLFCSFLLDVSFFPLCCL